MESVDNDTTATPTSEEIGTRLYLSDSALACLVDDVRVMVNEVIERREDEKRMTERVGMLMSELGKATVERESFKKLSDQRRDRIEMLEQEVKRLTWEMSERDRIYGAVVTVGSQAGQSVCGWTMEVDLHE